MPITIEQLFKDDFKPQWLSQKEAQVQESLRIATTVAVDYKWRKEAEETIKRISARVTSKNYLR